MARSGVPKFGNWENDDNVPYTVYFDKARKNRGGKMINPNDPQENPDMFPNTAQAQAAAPIPTPTPPTKPRTRPDEPTGRAAVRPTPEHRVNKDDGDFRQFSNSPARNENVGPRGQRGARAPTRPSAGSEQSFEKSPLHPHYQAKVMAGRGGGGSPAWEGGRSHDSSHGSNSKSRLRPSRGDESPERGAAVPRFGDWKEDDPQSAENYTHIFNKVREERNTGGPGNISGTPKNSSYGSQIHASNEPKKCCFPWW